MGKELVLLMGILPSKLSTIVFTPELYLEDLCDSGLLFIEDNWDIRFIPCDAKKQIKKLCYFVGDKNGC